MEDVKKKGNTESWDWGQIKNKEIKTMNIPDEPATSIGNHNLLHITFKDRFNYGNLLPKKLEILSTSLHPIKVIDNRIFALLQET